MPGGYFTAGEGPPPAARRRAPRVLTRNIDNRWRPASGHEALSGIPFRCIILRRRARRSPPNNNSGGTRHGFSSLGRQVRCAVGRCAGAVMHGGSRRSAGSDGALQLRGRLVRSAEGDLREDHRPEGGLHPAHRRREPRADPRRESQSACRHLSRRRVGFGQAARGRRPARSLQVAEDRRAARLGAADRRREQVFPDADLHRRAGLGLQHRAPRQEEAAGAQVLEGSRSIRSTRTRSRWRIRERPARRSTWFRRSCS
jgi:hypothetical protein